MSDKVSGRDEIMGQCTACGEALYGRDAVIADARQRLWHVRPCAEEELARCPAWQGRTPRTGNPKEG